MTNDQVPPQAELVKMVCGSFLSPPIRAVSNLGVPDKLCPSDTSADEFVHAIGTNPKATHRLMLVSVRVFAQPASQVQPVRAMDESLYQIAPGITDTTHALAFPLALGVVGEDARSETNQGEQS